MSLWWLHLRLLLWKDVYTYQFRRQRFLTVLEFLLPAFITYVYIYVASLTSTSAHKGNARLGLDVFAWAASYLGAVSSESENLIPVEGDDAYSIQQPPEALDEELLLPGDVEEQSAPRNDATYIKIMFGIFPYAVSMCMIQPFLVKKTASELCSGTKELMVTNGLSEFVWWLGGFCWSFIILLMGSLPATVLTKTHALLPRSNIVLLLMGVIMHCASSSLFCLVVATLVPRPSVGLVTMSFVVFGSLVVPFGLASSVPSVVAHGNVLEKVITLCLLLPNVAFNYFLINVADLGYQGGPGAHFSNMGRVGLHGTCVYRALHAMGGSCLVSAVLCWYLSNVWPHSYSFPEAYWFFLQPSYWGFWRRVDIPEEGLTEIKENTTLFEPLREQKQAHLVIYKLSKVINPLYLKHYIINNVTIKCYMDSITVILGRNGCGKSVLLRMLAGAIKPSSGTAFFDGADMRTNLWKVRANIGYCPQYSTLVPFFTVEENMLFIAHLRDAPDIDDLILTLLMQFQLIDKRESLTSKISYAEQRRLQVAMTLLDSPEFAFFDCPTEGIDSDSRNVIWDAILKCRAQTTVLIATNSTDVAEILGDRIAIISRSLISCCGSAIYLRKKYGQGYRLQLAVSSKCDKPLVCSFIEKRLSTAEKVLERRNIIVYSLGFTAAADIVRLLQQLEDSRIKLRVRRLSVSASSLEDVLLRLDETLEKGDTAAAEEDKGDVPSPDAKAPEIRNDLFRAQVGAIMTKKTTYLRRSYVVVPVLLLLQVLMLGAEEMYLRTGTLAWARVEALFPNFKTPQGQTPDQVNQAMVAAVDSAAFEMHTAIFAQRLASMVLVPVSMSLTASAYVDLPVKERVSGLKLLQLMTGLSSERYWLATFSTDLLAHAVSSLFCTLPLLFLDRDIWFCRDHYKLGTVLNVCISVFAPRTVSTYRPRRDLDGYLEIGSLPLRVMPQFTLARGTGQLRSAYLEYVACCHLGAEFLLHVCNYTFLSPTTRGEAHIVSKILKCCQVRCDHICPVYEEQQGIAPRSNSHVWDLTIFFLSGLLYLMLVIGWDMQTQGKFDPHTLDSFFAEEPDKADKPGGKEPSSEEKTVAEEKQFVAGLMRYLLINAEAKAKAAQASRSSEGDASAGTAESGADVHRAPAGLVVLEATMTGTLGPLSFHVPPAEVFGILGLGQAGRSLLLRIIAGIVRPDAGNVFINGIDARRRPLNYQQQVGYCPQQDPLLDKYTGEELVLLMARLRGVHKQELQAEVHYLDSRLGLRKALSSTVYNCSSTHRRKLTVAMALAGRPPVLVLDECTAGVDPATRSRLFQSLGRVHTECNLTVLFTSRRMSESDIFCDRLAILSYGSFMVLGRTVDIKQTCGQRCNVVIKMSSDQHGKKVSKQISRAVGDMFPNSVIAEVRKDQVWFRIRDDAIYWSEVFDGLETLKKRLKFGDYLVNDMSLGEIYLGYARERKMVDFGTIEIKYFDKLRPPMELEAPLAGAPPLLPQLGNA
ncbi:phospholipid-transporting ATPase ABCA3-like isoform X2 [Dermacentor albipictus]|uniref:phospholipid-transporting ATPase ABCA3-like isoform X2 n=1 Tax=Dermacentor albipictus TaxID=60249 RepID=UPI0031FD636F